jgi:mycofactocin system glycosyltransferase
VQVQEHDSGCVLRVPFPAKALSASKALTPVFRRLQIQGWGSIDELAPLVPGLSARSLKRFLYELEKRGFVSVGGSDLPDPVPSVCVIIPVRNRPKELRDCLNSLAKLDFPSEKLQIMVIDDASDDPAAAAAMKYPVSLHRMPQRRGASACRNWGAKRSDADIIAFLDSDCAAAPDWIKELLPAFCDLGAAAAGGLVDSMYESTALDRYEKVKSSLLVGLHSTDSNLAGRFFYVPSCNLAVLRETFLEVGGFNEDMEVGEDVDLCWRLIDGGHKIEYRPSAKVLHRHRNRLGPFCVRRFEYGTSEPMLQARHPSRRKEFVIRLMTLAFWCLGAAAIAAGSWAVGVGALATAALDAVFRSAKCRRAAAAVPFGWIAAAVFRSYLAFFYHCCAFVSRYYLIWAAVFCVLAPWAASALFACHLVAGVSEFFVKRPRVNLFAFLALFTLEQLSYQAGVWYGCVRRFFFAPVLPRISMSGPR